MVCVSPSPCNHVMFAECVCVGMSAVVWADRKLCEVYGGFVAQWREKFLIFMISDEKCVTATGMSGVETTR